MGSGSIWADRIRLTASTTVALATTTINLDTASSPGLAQYGITSGAAGVVDTITAAGAKDGDTLRLTYSNASITFAPGGNIKLPGARRVTLAGAGDEVTLVYNGTNWVVTGYQQVSGTAFAPLWCAFSAITGSSLVTTVNGVALAETAYDVKYDIPANGVAAGTTLKVVAMITGTTANAGANAYRFKMHLGPTSAPLTGPTIAGSIPTGPVLVSNGFGLFIVDLVFRSIGGAGTFTSSSRFSAVLNPAGSTAETGASLVAQVAQAIDTTVALSIVASVSTNAVAAVGTESTRLDQLSVFQA